MFASESASIPDPSPSPAPAIRSRPRVWTVFLVLVVVVLLQLIGGFAVALTLMFVRQGAVLKLMRTPPVFAASLALAVSVTALVGIAAVVASPTPWRRRVSLPSLRASPVDVLLVLFVALGLTGAEGTIAHWLGLGAHSTLRVFEAATAAARPGQLALFILLGSIAGIAEEFLFRGYAQTRLVSRWGTWAGILIAALFFGGMHFDWVQGSMAFGVGVLFGWVAIKRQSIATGIYAHAANNVVAFSLYWLLAGTGNATLYSPGVDLLLSAGLFGGALFLLRRRLNQPPEVPPLAPSTPDVEGSAATAKAEPSRPGRRRVFIVVGSGCLLLITIPAILLGGFLAIRLWSPKGRAMRARGSAFGAQHLERECLDTAITGGSGIPRDASEDLRRIFLRACLQKAHPSASFCEGVPAFSAFGKIRSWTRDACRGRPESSRRTCEPVMSAVIGYCNHKKAL